MRALKWVGSSLKDLKEFPIAVQQEMGYALHLAQIGEVYQSVKPFKGFGGGVYEIVSAHDKNAYRAVYVVNLRDAICVLHAFQKKSKQGIKTPKEELNVIHERLKYLQSFTK